MKNESGKSIVILVILTVLVIIGATVLINYAKEIHQETKVQDLKTNMLLMQAEAKKCLDEVCYQSVNLKEDKEEDLTKINEIKQKYLKGVIITSAPEEVKDEIKNIPEFNFDENCYYLDETTLTEIGIKNIDNTEDGYFIVKYDFSNVDVEVINTNGYNGKYTLTEIKQENEETQYLEGLTK